MSPAWNNLESMTALNNVLMWLAGIMGAVAAIAGFTFLFTNRQVENLKAKQSVRSLSAEQKTAFLLKLNEGKPSIICVQYDKVAGKEAREFADELADSLWMNGWRLVGDVELPHTDTIWPRRDIPGGRPDIQALMEPDIPDGITIEFYPNCLDEAGKRLGDALAAAGYAPNWRPMKIQANELKVPLILIIGPKPN